MFEMHSLSGGFGSDELAAILQGGVPSLLSSSSVSSFSGRSMGPAPGPVDEEGDEEGEKEDMVEGVEEDEIFVWNQEFPVENKLALVISKIRPAISPNIVINENAIVVTLADRVKRSWSIDRAASPSAAKLWATPSKPSLLGWPSALRSQ